MAEKHCRRSLIRCKKIVYSYSETVKQGEGIVLKPSLQSDRNFRPQTMNSTEDRWNRRQKYEQQVGKGTTLRMINSYPRSLGQTHPGTRLGQNRQMKMRTAFRFIFSSSNNISTLNLQQILSKLQLRFLPFFLIRSVEKMPLTRSNEPGWYIKYGVPWANRSLMKLNGGIFRWI